MTLTQAVTSARYGGPMGQVIAFYPRAVSHGSEAGEHREEERRAAGEVSVLRRPKPLSAREIMHREQMLVYLKSCRDRP